MEGLLLRDMEVGSRFRTLLTDRVGTLRQKEQYCLVLTWADWKGPRTVHRNLIVEPWPRDA